MAACDYLSTLRSIHPVPIAARRPKAAWNLRSLSCTYAYDQQCESNPRLFHLESIALPTQPDASIWGHESHTAHDHIIFYFSNNWRQKHNAYMYGSATTTQTILSGSFCAGNNLHSKHNVYHFSCCSEICSKALLRDPSIISWSPAHTCVTDHCTQLKLIFCARESYMA